MTATVRLEWHGDKLKQRLRAATVSAINDLDAAVAETARHDHPGWQSRTGEAETSIAAVPARATADGDVEGGAGFGARHGRFLEFGARGHPGDRTIARAVERLGDGLARRIRDRIGT